MLAGIVVNNAIVLIDYVNQLRRESGMKKLEAVLRQAEFRLRPILMTTSTTVLGLLLRHWVWAEQRFALRWRLRSLVV